MKKIQFNIDWSVVFWISIIILFLWLIAKAVGLIHSPWFIEAIPYVVGFFSLLAIAKEIGKYAQKINTLIEDVKELKFCVINIDKRLIVVETKIDKL